MKKHTLEYIEWDDLQKALETKLGIKDLRNCANWNLGNPNDPEHPYRDFWHTMIDHFSELIHNGCYLSLDIENYLYDIKQDYYDNQNKDNAWELPIWEAMAEILGPGTHHIHIEW